MPANLSIQQIEEQVIPKIIKSFPELQGREAKYRKLQKLLTDAKVDINFTRSLFDIINSDASSEDKLKAISKFLLSQQQLAPQYVAQINSIIHLQQNQTERLQTAFALLNKQNTFTDEEMQNVKRTVSIVPEDFLRLVPKFLLVIGADNDHYLAISQIFEDNKADPDLLIESLEFYSANSPVEDETVDQLNLLLQGQGQIVDDYRIEQLLLLPSIQENREVKKLLTTRTTTDDVKLYYLREYLRSTPDINIPEWLIELIEGRQLVFRNLREAYDKMIELVEEPAKIKELYGLPDFSLDTIASALPKDDNVKEIKDALDSLNQALREAASLFQDYLKSARVITGKEFDEFVLLDFYIIVNEEGLTGDFRQQVLRAILQKSEEGDVKAFVENYINGRKRKLTEEEILYILEDLPAPTGDSSTSSEQYKGVSDHTREEIAKSLQKQLREILITPLAINDLKARIRNRFNKARQIPHRLVGILAAAAMGSTVTQMTLNSLDWEEVVMVKEEEFTEEANESEKYDTVISTIVLPIGKIVDALLENCDPQDIQLFPMNRTEYFDTRHMNMYVTCVDEFGKMSWQKLEAVTRHLPPCIDGSTDLLKITTENGRTVRATKSKSFLIRKDNKIIEVKGTELRVGDYVPVVKKSADVEDKIYEIDISEYNEFFKNDCWREDSLTLDFNAGYFVGAYTASGFYIGDEVVIDFPNVDCAEPIVHFCDKHFLSYTLRENRIEIQDGLVAEIIADCCYKTKTKKLPYFSSQAEDEFIRGILSGIFSNCNSETELSFSAPNKLLCDQIADCCEAFGIFAKIVHQENKKNKWNLRIEGENLQIFENEIALANPTKQQYITDISVKQTNNRIIAGINTEHFQGNYKYETIQKFLRENGLLISDGEREILERSLAEDVVCDRIVSLENVKSSHKCVYDFTVAKTKNFTVLGGLCVRDTFHKAGSQLNVTSGIERTQELILNKKKAKSASCKVLYEQKVTFEEAREIMLDYPEDREAGETELIGYSFDEILEKRREIVGLTVEDLLIGDPIISNTIDLFENVPWWYEASHLLNGTTLPSHARWFLRLKMNPLMMYKYKVTMRDVAEKISTGLYENRKVCQAIHCMDLYHSPDGLGVPDEENEELEIPVIDIFPGSKLEQVRKDMSYGVAENQFNFLNQVVKPYFSKIFVQGIENIRQAFPESIPYWDFVQYYEKNDLLFIDDDHQIDVSLLKTIGGYTNDQMKEMISLYNKSNGSNSQEKPIREEPIDNVETLVQIVVELQKQNKYWNIYLNKIRCSQYGVKNVHIARLCWAAGLIVTEIDEGGYELQVYSEDGKSPEDVISKAISKDKEDARDVQEENLKKKVVPSRRPDYREDGTPYISAYSNLWYVQTIGTNLKDILKMRGVDNYITHSNFPREEMELFGIEAARTRLLIELVSVFSQEGDLMISLRHVLLLVDFMTTLGEIVPLSYSGMTKQSNGFFSRAAYERAMETITKAALAGETESTKSVSAAIAVGARPAMGTGAVEVSIDRQKYKDLDKIKNMVIDERELEKAFETFTLDSDMNTYTMNEGDEGEEGEEEGNQGDYGDQEWWNFDPSASSAKGTVTEGDEELPELNEETLGLDDAFDPSKVVRPANPFTAFPNDTNTETIRTLEELNDIPATLQDEMKVSINDGPPEEIQNIAPPI